MKIIFLILLNITILFSFEYDSLVMRAQASIFPKLILLDKNIASKTSDDSILISIVYNDNERLEAIEVKELIDKKYKGGISNYKLNIKLANINDISYSEKSSAYYILNAKGKEALIRHAIDTKTICFSYSSLDFKHKSLLSVSLKEKTYIYLNGEALKEYKINFIPIVYKIVKVK